MKNSKIEWCDATVNMWWGCSKVSPGCTHCYADALSHRWGKDIWGTGKPREDHRAGATKLALQLSRQAEREARRIRVFSASMSDWLDEEVPIEWLADLLALIHATPNLDWLLLTKRPENFQARVAQALMHLALETPLEQCTWLADWLGVEFRGARNPHAPDNVWIGTTVEDQQRADERIPALLQIPARVRFLSCEPLLGELDLSKRLVSKPCWNCGNVDGEAGRCYCGIETPSEISWVICGGESGSHARPMHPDWARSLRDQCAAAGVPFFFKQWGEHRCEDVTLADADHISAIDREGADWSLSISAGSVSWAAPGENWSLDHDHLPKTGLARIVRPGKKTAGRLLDGVEHNTFPAQ